MCSDVLMISLLKAQSRDVQITNKSENLDLEGRDITSRSSGKDKKILGCFDINSVGKRKRKLLTCVSKKLTEQTQKRPFVIRFEFLFCPISWDYKMKITYLCDKLFYKYRNIFKYIHIYILKWNFALCVMVLET